MKTKDIQIVQSTWQYMIKRNQAEQVGTELLKNMFSIDPDAIGLFNFKNDFDLYESPTFKEYAKIVVDTMGMVIFGLKDDFKVTDKQRRRLKRLG